MKDRRTPRVRLTWKRKSGLEKGEKGFGRKRLPVHRPNVHGRMKHSESLSSENFLRESMLYIQIYGTPIAAEAACAESQQKPFDASVP